MKANAQDGWSTPTSECSSRRLLASKTGTDEQHDDFTRSKKWDSTIRAWSLHELLRNKKSAKQICYDDFCKIISTSLRVLYELYYGVTNLILIKRGLCCTFSLR